MDCPGTSSSVEIASLADDCAVDSTRAAARDHDRPSWSTATLTERSSLGKFGASSIMTISSAAATRSELGQSGKKWSPGATCTRQGTQDFPRNTIQTCSALGTRQETQQHVVQSQLSPKSQGTRAVAEQRSSTRPLPPSRKSTILRPAEPSSRSHHAAPRALAPEVPGHLPRVVRSGCWQSVQTRPEALSTNVCPRRCMGGTGARSPVSHACDGQVCRVPRRPDAWRGPVLQNESRISQVVPQPSQHRFRNFAHGEVVAQAPSGINFLPDVTPQVRHTRTR